jgi:hypothetical protein
VERQRGRSRWQKIGNDLAGVEGRKMTRSSRSKSSSCSTPSFILPRARGGGREWEVRTVETSGKGTVPFPEGGLSPLAIEQFERERQ